jgi:hypothetical protein
MRAFAVIPLSPFSNSLFGRFSALLHDMPERAFEILLCFALSIVSLSLIGTYTIAKALVQWVRESHRKR